MTTFKISFFLSIPINQKTLNILNEKPTEEKQSSPRLKAKSQFICRDFQIEPVFNIELNAFNVAHAIHISYELIPHKCRYEIEVMCWGPIAKILTRDGHINVYTIMKNELIWIPILVEHRVNDLTISLLKVFKEYVIEFEIFNSVSETATNFKREKVIVRYNDIIENDVFVQNSAFNVFYDRLDFATKSTITKGTIFKSSRFHTRSNITTATAGSSSMKYDCTSCLSSHFKSHVLFEIIDKVSKGETVRTTEYIPHCESIIRRNENEMLIHSKGKVDKEETVCLTVPAEIFFTNPSMSIYQTTTNNCSFVKNFFVILSVEKLLVRAQKLALNPLVINIIKINNFPADELIKLGFKTVFAYYEIPEVLSCRTQTKSIEKTMHFNNAHMYFTDEIKKIKVIEGLQTQTFFVEIYGNREITETQPKGQLFGESPKDFMLSQIKPSFENNPASIEEDKPVLLAVNLFDLSSLVDNIWNFRERGQCHQPYLTLTSKPNYDKIKNKSTVSEINLNYKKVSVVIPECTFIELGTTLTLQAYLMAPQSPSLDYHHATNTFKRIFVIAEDENFSKLLYNQVESHNSSILADIHTGKDLEQLDILTGFILDNGTNHFFYIEGPSTGFILNLWHIIEDICPDAIERRSANSSVVDEKVNNVTTSRGKIFFNSGIAFEKRLYMNFLSEGLYQIVLKIPFQDILANPLLYLRKNGPKPCMEALKKLSLLFHSNNYKDILQQYLLPTSQELISLNLEWGVPYRFKEKTFY